jgi:hypothetical protein
LRDCQPAEFMTNSTTRMFLTRWGAAVAVWLSCAGVHGQTYAPDRLPPVIATDDPLFGPPTLGSGGVAFQSTGPEQAIAATETEIDAAMQAEITAEQLGSPPKLVIPPKPGIFQEDGILVSWLPRGKSGFGSLDVDVWSTFGFPFPTREAPLLVTPEFENHYLDGPRSPVDLPSEIYDSSVQFRHMRRFSPRFAMDLAVTPGWHGDYDGNFSDGFRLPSRALGIWTWNPEVQLLLGVLYMDRNDVNWLPAGGVIWSPDNDSRYELIVPRPRIARRFYADYESEEWWYVSGELGGGTYAVQRESGAQDIVTLSDLRLIFGLERKTLCGFNRRLELGYVFARQIEYESDTPEFEPDDTVMVRLGGTY